MKSADGAVSECAGDETIGLVGIGLLGTALAERLLGSGRRVVGYDIEPDRRRHLASIGGRAVDEPAEVAAASPMVLLSLPTSDVSADVVERLRPAMARGGVIVDATTGEPDRMRSLGDDLLRFGVDYVDACVAGNSEEARAGAVLALVGGSGPAVERVRPILETFAKTVFHLGPVGAGASMKLAFNLALGLHRAVLAEALGFAAAIGVVPERALEVLQAGSAASRIMAGKGPKMLARDYRPQARLDQHLKDVELIVDLARRHGAKTPLSAAHRELLRRLSAEGKGELDNSAIYEAYR